MAKGKFESGRSAGQTDPFAAHDKIKKTDKLYLLRQYWPILAAVAAVLVLVVGILLLTRGGGSADTTAANTDEPLSTMELLGMPRPELEKRFRELDTQIRQDLVLTLNPIPQEDGQTEEPIILRLTPAETGAHLDITKLTADLDAGVGQERGDSFLLDPRDYLVLDETTLRANLNTLVAQYGTEYAAPTSRLDSLLAEDLDRFTQRARDQGLNPDDLEMPDKVLVVKVGTTGRTLDVKTLMDTVTEAYTLALVAEDPLAAMSPSLTYKVQIPDPVDLDALWTRYCKDPVEPEIDRTTGEITDGSDGYGFDRAALEEELATAVSGDELRVPMGALHPTTDAEVLRSTLFKDVLAEAHTPHSAIYNRTTNLKLACAEIDGTVLMPGEVFSFNQVVGERTEAKGYKEAIAYVSGGESKPELGGGVCQVASSIYYAVLKADLKTVEREPHMFLVDYVPQGMDATIYWGYHDYRFENNSPYPIKIEASVSDGKVHIVLLGTEWKDYTVTLSYEITAKEDWREVKLDVPNDGTYTPGQVITTPYTGYTVVTYKTLRNNTTGAEEKVQIAISRYSKRDKVVANPVDSLNPTEPTEPSSEPTEPPTQPTEPPTQPTQPPTQPTEPPTQPTQPPTQPTEPPTQPTEPPTQPTEPPTQPTEPPTEPTEPPTQPTEPPTEPSEEPTEPSQEGGEG